MSVRILIVEDDDVARAMLSAWVHTQGWTFESVTTSTAARAALAGREFDLMLCDVNLPDGDGPEIIPGLDGANAGLPVILLTGNPSLETAIRSVRLRVVAYLLKPPNLDELHALIEREVAVHRQRRAIAASRRRLQEWDAELARLEQRHELEPGASALDLLHATLRQLGGVLLEFDRSVAMLAASPATREVLSQVELLASLRRTVQVIDRTRFHFKSKDLGELRRELEGVLDRIGSEAGEEKASTPGPARR